ncbi:MAG: Ig-like domain-containing protein [Gammaproteobacteria bacterium]
MPGTQPNEVTNFESPDKCDNCHAGYNDDTTIGHPQDEPATGWRGGAMGNAGRDPIFWATLAIAEQDFDGSGDLCIRCHSTGGWQAGRSTPTDGSGLAASDDDGVECDACHKMTNPDNSEHVGIMVSPFTANCSDDPLSEGTCQSPDEAYYGSGMLSLWPGSDKLGPYDDADARHQFMQSGFHRDVDFCGSCHDVSNPAVGDLAPNHGAQTTAPSVVAEGTPGGPVADKAAFNNPPYAYGIVERTFSEYKASALPTTRVGEFTSLPADLRAAGGSLDVTYQAAMIAASDALANGGIAGDYADGSPRYFSCQSCHMRPVESAGANKRGVQIRKDLPRHDHTGGNYWFSDMAKYQDARGTLRLGGDLSAVQVEAMAYGQQRAVEHLQQAASLQVSGDTLKVVNLTGHKLISGYPEGRRMWLNIHWYDSNGQLLREDGGYGDIGATVVNPAGGPDVSVESIIDPASTRIYEAHYAVTREWAQTLMGVDPGLYGPIVLNYDRVSGTPGPTIGDLADGNAGDYQKTFHFVLNNHVVSDNRIPPYGMRYDEALRRNALPVPASQYGGGSAGSIYDYWDEIDLGATAPAGAVSAEIDLLYQGTSWEYIQFLYLANNGQNAFLGQEGVNMLDAWINAEVPVAMEVNGDRKMVPPVLMASTTWGTTPGGNTAPVASSDSYSTPEGTLLTVTAPGVLGNDSDPDGDAMTAVLVAGTSSGSLALNDDGSFSYTPDPGFTGEDAFSYQASDGSGLSNAVTVTLAVTPTGGTGTASVGSLESGVITGKGKNATYNQQDGFSPGDTVTLRALTVDSQGDPLEGATLVYAISGPASATVTSEPSGADGFAYAEWSTTSKGKNPTPTGDYTATVAELTANGYAWDGVATSIRFALQ